MSKVVIIGGGVAGLCSAWYCLKDGHSVTVIDRGGSEGTGCSWGNAGMIVPSHFVPLAAPGMPLKGLKMMFDPAGPFSITPRWDKDLFRWATTFLKKSTASHVQKHSKFLWEINEESRLLYQTLSEELGFNLSHKGLIIYCKEKSTLKHEIAVAKQAEAIGVSAQVMTREELRALDPGLKLSVEGGVYYSGDSFFDPVKFMVLLRSRLKLQGVTFIEKKVSKPGVRANHLTDIEGIEGDVFVVAAGVWSSGLLKHLEIPLPMQGGKGYSFTLERPHHLPEICSILLEARIAVTPMDGKLRFAGTMQLDGVNEEISVARLNRLKESIPDYFPEYSSTDFDDLETWVGLRPCSPDGLPYVGKVASYDNLFVATGGAMMGMSLGPWMGHCISEFIAGKDKVNLKVVSPIRYT